MSDAFSSWDQFTDTSEKKVLRSLLSIELHLQQTNTLLAAILDAQNLQRAPEAPKRKKDHKKK